MNAVESNGSKKIVIDGASSLAAGGCGYLAYKGLYNVARKTIGKHCKTMLNSTDNAIFFKGVSEASNKYDIPIVRAEQLADDFSRSIWYKGYRNVTKNGIETYAAIDRLVPQKLLELQENATKSNTLTTKFVKKFLSIKGYIATKWYKNNILGFDEKKIKALIEGTNAVSNEGIAYANFDKASAALPHEMGHAKIFGNKFGKLLQSSKIPILAVGLATAIAAATLIPEQKDNDVFEKQNFWSKTKSFLKKNCVGIAAAAWVPTLLEEGMASIIGYSMTKNYLPKNACKFMKNCYGKAWLTYAVGALISTGGVFVAKKVKELLTSN